MGLVALFKRAVTWWNGCTLNTWIHTLLHGVKVGEDAFGNVYYRSRDGRRRWVIYAGEAEASTVPPDWHGWLHFTWDEPPSERPLVHKAWEKPHKPNLTGTPLTYVPPGSLLRPKPAEFRDYEPWQPE